MTEKELKSRTYNHLIKLAKELNVQTSKNITKNELITVLLKIKKRKLNSAEKKVSNTNFSYKNHIILFGYSINRYLLFFLAFILFIYFFISLSIRLLGNGYNYSSINLNGDIYIKTKTPYKENKVLVMDDLVVNPLCGCEKEKPHYGLSFFSKSFKVNINNETPVNLEIFSPNSVLVSFEDFEKNDTLIAKRIPFNIRFHCFEINEKAKYFNNLNLNSYIYYEFNKKLENGKISVIDNAKYNRLIIDGFKGKIEVIALDEHYIASLSPPFNSELIIKRQFSPIQNKILSYKIINKKFGKKHSPEIDIMGQMTAYVFKPLKETKISGIPIIEQVKKNGNLCVIVAFSYFSQRLTFFDQKENLDFTITTENPLDEIAYKQMVDTLEKRRNSEYYKARFPNIPSAIILKPPFLKNLPNGIHFFGEFEKLSSEEVTGKIIKKNGNEIVLTQPTSVTYNSVDKIKFINEPIIFTSKKNNSYMNIFQTNGNIKIHNFSFINQLAGFIKSFYKELFAFILSSVFSFISSIGLIRKRE